MSKPARSLEEVIIRTGLAEKWEARGEARGVALGENKGRESATLDIAKNMVKSGFPIETIISMTDLEN